MLEPDEQENRAPEYHDEAASNAPVASSANVDEKSAQRRAKRQRQMPRAGAANLSKTACAFHETSERHMNRAEDAHKDGHPSQYLNG